MEKSDRLLCVLFGVILAAFFLAGLFKPQKGFSEFENRYLSRKPELSAKGILSGEYMKKYEAYVTDQFPFRNQWITGKTIAERVMLKTEINGVYFAKDSYYIERYKRAELFSELSAKNQERLADFIGGQERLMGKEHVSVMLVPSASCILKERLPVLAPEDGQEELLDRIRESLPEGVFVDVYGKLAEHSEEEIYYRTDHHWTTLGAFYGYCAWKEKQGEAAPSVSDYEQVCLSDSFMGTLYAKVNLGMKPDRIYAFQRPGEKLRMRLDLAEEWTDTVYVKEKLLTRDQYAVFCGGNHALTEIEAFPVSPRHLLIVKDSYAHCFAPFLTADFGRITMVDLRYYNGRLGDYIRDNQVTDVLVLYSLPGFLSDKSVNKMR